jgi:hypothetical protein
MGKSREGPVMTFLWTRISGTLPNRESVEEGSDNAPPKGDLIRQSEHSQHLLNRLGRGNDHGIFF